MPWRERLLGALTEYRRLLLAHRDAARILTPCPRRRSPAA
ncbi:hypothetical protein LDL49_44635 [Nonomuraea sp. NEAU-L178]|nr:hypothetical protein [Nonomuraea aurantiaca]